MHMHDDGHGNVHFHDDGLDHMHHNSEIEDIISSVVPWWVKLILTIAVIIFIVIMVLR